VFRGATCPLRREAQCAVEADGLAAEVDVLGDVPGQLGLFIGAPHALGERERLDSLDLTRALAAVTLHGARATRVGAGRDAAAWLAEVRDLVLAASEGRP
jgi:hypothetical protein